jgi:hypothetical protein
MKLSSLDALLAKSLSPSAFRAQLAPDLAEYLNADVKGSVMPVRVTEDKDIQLSTAHVRELCELFINKQLTPEELAFVADALQLADRVDFDEEVPDLIAEMTDPEINGPFTIAHAREILESV